MVETPCDERARYCLEQRLDRGPSALAAVDGHLVHPHADESVRDPWVHLTVSFPETEFDEAILVEVVVRGQVA